MSIRSRLAIFSAFALLAIPQFASAADEPQIREGNWEISVTAEIPNMPMKMPAVKTTHCITKEEASDPNKTLPKPGKNDCKVNDYKVDGNKVTWTMDCPKDKMSVKGTMTFQKDAYDGKMEMTNQGQGMTMAFSGKRLGDCSK